MDVSKTSEGGGAESPSRYWSPPPTSSTTPSDSCSPGSSGSPGYAIAISTGGSRLRGFIYGTDVAGS
jgi:hypothetical protein